LAILIIDIPSETIEIIRDNPKKVLELELKLIASAVSTIEIYATNAEGLLCGKCMIILSWASGMNYLAAVDRVFELIRTTKL
jgi:hypothetical protein